MLFLKKPLAIAVVLSTWTSTVLANDPLTLNTSVVTSNSLAQSQLRMVSSSEVLTEDQLQFAQSATLGETVNQMPGVWGSSFGSGASRPVIRGMDAGRVKVLSNGIDSLDASTMSADHAVTIEPMFAERIEILKGPATLLYGGGAIGGVVNVIDRKIPTQIPDKGYALDLQWQGNTVAKENLVKAGATLAQGSFALRVEGLKRNADPYHTAGRADNSHKHKQEGSYNDTNTFNIGTSWITDNGYTGIAYSRQANEYGLLAHEHGHCHTHGHGAGLNWHCGSHGHGHGHDHDHDEHGIPYIDMLQKRWDLRSEYDINWSGFEHVRFALGHTDYQHKEIEGSEVATQINNKATEARLELTHAPIAGWRGVIGGQIVRQDFRNTGEEAYVPNTLSKNQALFLLEEYEQGDWRYELGARHEWQTIDVRNRPLKNKSHNGTSFSAGAVWQFAPEYSLASSVSRSQRLPVADELYAFGPHAASRTIEQGNINLDKETSHNVDISLRKTQGFVTFNLTAYRNQIKDYIYAADTGERPGAGYRVIQYRQNDATFNGIEGDINFAFNTGTDLTFWGDHVRGKLKHHGNLARIPSDRIGVRVKQQIQDDLTGQVSFTRVQAQNTIADFESKTSGYNLLGAALIYDGRADVFNYQLFVRADNLLNVKAREHTSWIKDQVQLPGRNFTAGVKVSF